MIINKQFQGHDPSTLALNKRNWGGSVFYSPTSLNPLVRHTETTEGAVTIELKIPLKHDTDSHQAMLILMSTLFASITALYLILSTLSL